MGTGAVHDGGGSFECMKTSCAHINIGWAGDVVSEYNKGNR